MISSFQNIFESFEQHETSKIDDSINFKSFEQFEISEIENSTVFKSFQQHKTSETHFLNFQNFQQSPKLQCFLNNKKIRNF